MVSAESRTLFIGNVPYALTEHDVMEAIRPYAQLQTVRMKKDPLSNQNRGFVFSCGR